MQLKSIALIDGSSLYTAANLLNKQIDFVKLKGACPHAPSRTLYYSPVRPNLEHDPIRPLLDWLDFNGYNVVEKYLREFKDPDTQVTRYKGSVVTDMIIDLMELPERIDHVTIFSGDGDLVRAVQSIQRRGISVSIVSLKAIISDELRRQADLYIDMDDSKAPLDIFKTVEPKAFTMQEVARVVPRRKVSQDSKV